MIETVPEISSTNAALLKRLAGGEDAPEGFWLVADRQSAGRGRSGRSWSDGFGNFMGSTVAVLRTGDPMPQTLAIVAGLAAYNAVKAIAPSLGGVMLKWPNDLLVGSAKLAGILLERQKDAVVVGIGVNVALAPVIEGRETTSLAQLSVEVSRDDFAAVLAREWAVALDRWHGGEWPQLRQEWLAVAHTVGTPITVKDADQATLLGAFGGVDENGVALLRLADGSTRAIHAGDIDLVGR